MTDELETALREVDVRAEARAHAQERVENAFARASAGQDAPDFVAAMLARAAAVEAEFSALHAALDINDRVVAAALASAR